MFCETFQRELNRFACWPCQSRYDVLYIIDGYFCWSNCALLDLFFKKMRLCSLVRITRSPSYFSLSVSHSPPRPEWFFRYDIFCFLLISQLFFLSFKICQYITWKSASGKYYGDICLLLNGQPSYTCLIHQIIQFSETGDIIPQLKKSL